MPLSTNCWTPQTRFPKTANNSSVDSHRSRPSHLHGGFGAGVTTIGAPGSGWFGKWIFPLAFLLCARALAEGNWLTLADPGKAAVQLMILMSDGTVICANNPSPSSSSAGFVWYRLTPDPFGHYVEREWSDIAPMHDSRLYYSSRLLHDGRLFIAGGEYGTGGANAEICDPLTDLWTQINPLRFWIRPSPPRTVTGFKASSTPNPSSLPTGRY